MEKNDEEFRKGIEGFLTKQGFNEPKAIAEAKKELNKPNPNTPLPYKGMDTRTEIASRIYGSIIKLVVGSWRKGTDEDKYDNVDIQEECADIAVQYADVLIKRLNEQYE